MRVWGFPYCYWTSLVHSSLQDVQLLLAKRTKGKNAAPLRGNGSAVPSCEGDAHTCICSHVFDACWFIWLGRSPLARETRPHLNIPKINPV